MKENIQRLFICDIMCGDKDDIDLEQILIRAISLKDAFQKLVDYRKYVSSGIIELWDNRLFGHVELKDSLYPVRHVIIGDPKELIE